MTHSREPVRAAERQLRAQATRLAGGIHDLQQRAMTYHHLYQHSGGNHIFPLIAAHGALWAAHYFRFGMRLGWCLSLPDLLTPKLRRARLAALERFADAFRDVNRRVCIDTYVNYHLVRQFTDSPALEEMIPADLLGVLRMVELACRGGENLNDAQKRAVFQAHFLNEQEYVVGPSVQQAADQFGWKLMKWIALQPRVHFAYFPAAETLRFRNFLSRAERVQNGLSAFDLATEAGWSEVESALQNYRLLPASYLSCPEMQFAMLQQSLLLPAMR